MHARWWRRASFERVSLSEARAGVMSARSVQVQILLAFLAIYILWGSTFLAIRVAVETVPPLFAAGVRFTIAGAVLFGWSRVRGTPSPSPHEWRNVWVLGVLMFLLSYSALF